MNKDRNNPILTVIQPPRGDRERRNAKGRKGGEVQGAVRSLVLGLPGAVRIWIDEGVELSLGLDGSRPRGDGDAEIVEVTSDLAAGAADKGVGTCRLQGTAERGIGRSFVPAPGANPKLLPPGFAHGRGSRFGLPGQGCFAKCASLERGLSGECGQPFIETIGGPPSLVFIPGAGFADQDRLPPAQRHIYYWLREQEVPDDPPKQHSFTASHSQSPP